MRGMFTYRALLVCGYAHMFSIFLWPATPEDQAWPSSRGPLHRYRVCPLHGLPSNAPQDALQAPTSLVKYPSGKSDEKL